MSNKQNYSSRTKPFAEEDHLRISRLREEIVARITEVSLIMARTLKIAPPSGIREFLLTDGPSGESLEISVIKTNGPKTDSATGKAEIIHWGCTCHTNKKCCSDPECPPCP